MALPSVALLQLLSSTIMRTMDTSVDPCEDFYSFACGHYKTYTKLVDGKPWMEPWLEIDRKIAQQLREILESSNAGKQKSALVAQQYYRSCMNLRASEALGTGPISDKLNDFGGWPVVLGDKWKESSYDWMAVAARLFMEAEISPIVKFKITVNQDDTTRKILKITAADLGLNNEDFYLDSDYKKTADAYYRFMVSTAVQLGADEKAARSEMRDVMNLETALANVSSCDTKSDFADRMEKVGDLENNDELPYKTWFIYMRGQKWPFGNSETVAIGCSEYLERLPELLKKFSIRTIANYQMWLFVKKFFIYLAPSLRDDYQLFKKAVVGSGALKSRWLECVYEVWDNMKWSIGAMYVKNYFDTRSKKQVEQMVTNIREAMKQTIKQSTWMDRQTEGASLRKLASMQQKVAYPENIFNETKLLEGLPDQLAEDQYFSNALIVIRYRQENNIKKFHEPVNRNEWDDSPATVNAFYDDMKNEIVVPAGYLQYPMYSADAPEYHNYGRIGSIIAHEISHGYDDRGRRYDSNGRLKPWWTVYTESRFKNGTKCFIDQYSDIKDSVTGQHLKGANTLNENIADNIGIKLAYKAYTLLLKSTDNKSQKAEDKPLAGLQNYTIDQLFFISFAQSYCSVVRPEYLRYYIVADAHSPWQYRVNIPLQNFDAFAGAFHCPAGSEMNPTRKCNIW